MDKQELVNRMKNARSWTELGLSIQEVCNALTDNKNITSTSSNTHNESDELKMLREKVERLSETNKQLRAENKSLKGKK